MTIVDFKYSPGSSTVHVGDTITWTNNGPSSHTATARDGSFNTGVLRPGQSASHTFTQPGTYTFYCQIHPFMHGTIVVLAPTTASTPAAASGTTNTSPSSGSSSPSAPSSASPSSPSPTATSSLTSSSSSSGNPGSTTASSGGARDGAPAADASGTLPLTGMNVAAGLIWGVVIAGFGLTLRRRFGR